MDPTEGEGMADEQPGLSKLAWSLREAEGARGPATGEARGPATGGTPNLPAEGAGERADHGTERRGAPLLEVRALDVSYGNQQILFGVDLNVSRGEVLALLGTNGAGKSTLLRTISGLNRPDRGELRLDGSSIRSADAARRVVLGIGHVPGGRGVFPGLSVLDNLMAGCHTFAWDRARVRKRIALVLDLFPKLGQRLDQVAGALSGGEQQMLALARGLLLEPRLLLVDELSLGLAPVVVQELLGVVTRLRDSGTAIVVVEQSINVALSIADRAVWMEKGRVRFEGSAADLIGRHDLVKAVYLGAPATASSPAPLALPGPFEPGGTK